MTGRVEQCVVYRLTQEDGLRFVQSAMRHECMDEEAGEVLAELMERLEFLEVWHGAPIEHEFSDQVSAGGRHGHRAEGEGLYIWLTPTVCQALAENPRALIIATGRRNANGLRISYTWLPKTMILSEAIAETRGHNQDMINGAIAKLASQSRAEAREHHKPQRQEHGSP